MKYNINYTGEEINNILDTVSSFRTIASGSIPVIENSTLQASNIFMDNNNDTHISGSVLEGHETTNIGNYNHLEGHKSTTDNTQEYTVDDVYDDESDNSFCSHAEGNATMCKSSSSHTEGKLTKTEGNCSHAEGYATSAGGANTPEDVPPVLPEGTDADDFRYHKNSHAEGAETIAYGHCAHAEGRATQANGGAAHSEGCGTVATGPRSHAEGSTTQAIGPHSHAEGLKSQANNKASHAEGSESKAFGAASHAEGYGSVSYGDNSHVEGSHCEAGISGQNIPNGHAEGNRTKALGKSSHSEGNETQAINLYDHAEGCGTIAQGNSSHAEGELTQANGIRSHAEGYSTKSVGEASHAEGRQATANGWYSHAEGFNTTANGKSSHAEGANTIASGSYSHAGGDHTHADYDSQFVIGSYNKKSEGTFLVGVGDANSEKNAFEAGKLACHNFIKIGNSIFTEDQLNAVINNNKLRLLSAKSTIENYSDSTNVHYATFDLLFNRPVRIANVTESGKSNDKLLLRLKYNSGTQNYRGNFTYVDGVTLNSQIYANHIRVQYDNEDGGSLTRIINSTDGYGLLIPGYNGDFSDIFVGIGNEKLESNITVDNKNMLWIPSINYAEASNYGVVIDNEYNKYNPS